MFEYQITGFGLFSKHTLINAATGDAFSIVPEAGAALQSLMFGGVEVIDGDQTHQEADFNKWSKGRLLFPFPNRLRDGAYEWAGQSYQFKLNDPDTGNALHGFGLDRAFEVEHVECTDSSALMRCVYEYTGDNAAYPFSFIFKVSYTWSEHAFTLELSCLNTSGEAMPWGFGWHPYFKLADKVDEMSLQLPPLEWVGIDERMIPTGKRYAYDEFESLRAIRATVLDNCFAVLDEAGPKLNVYLAGSRGRLRYWQEVGTGKFPFIQLFTPPHRTSLAVEPMSCNIDAFHNGEGLLRVEAGQCVVGRCGVVFEQPA